MCTIACAMKQIAGLLSLMDIVFQQVEEEVAACEKNDALNCCANTRGGKKVEEDHKDEAVSCCSDKSSQATSLASNTDISSSNETTDVVSQPFQKPLTFKKV